jgi:site-specific DNA-methyltransferase (adenine-specific)
MKTNTIYCGECAEIMRRHIPNDSIDLTVTSPPYDNLRDYNGYVFEFEKIAQQLWRVTKPGGVVVWVVGDATINGSETLTSFRQAIYFNGLGFNVETMIYEVAGTGAKGSNYYYWQAFEFMFILSNGNPKAVNRITFPIKNRGRGDRRTRNGKKIIRPRAHRDESIRGNIWRYSGDRLDQHPAPFPEALARDHIISWSNPGDIVLDPMCGSGTTLKMSVEQGRRYIGIDISQEYCDLSRRRVRGARVPLPGMEAGGDLTRD